MPKISRDRGKRFELQVAKYLDGKRNHFETEDIKHPVVSVECKHREKLPVTMTKWYAQAKNAAEGGRIPVVACHEKYQPIGESLVIVSLDDLKQLLDRATSNYWEGSAKSSYTGPYTDED